MPYTFHNTVTNMSNYSLYSLMILLSFSFSAYGAQSISNKIESKLPVCLYIASYAPGYSWQDGIKQGLSKTLKGHCRIKTFFMNSKKVTKKVDLKNIGLEAKKFIEMQSPKVVIVSDDNAVKYVLEPYYKNNPIPFVFCGVNNSGALYGLPYKNTTGMVEKNPTESLFKLLFSLQPSKTHIAFLTTEGTSANRDIANFNKFKQNWAIEGSTFAIKTEQEWRRVYKQLQEDPNVDIILFSNRAALKTWDHNKNLEWIKKHNHKISVTTQDWMMPYVALGMNKVSSEQGIWAGQAAIAILNGVAPNKISVVPNQNFQLWINPEIAKPFKKLLPENTFSHALIYDAKGNK